MGKWRAARREGDLCGGPTASRGHMRSLSSASRAAAISSASELLPSSSSQLDSLLDSLAASSFSFLLWPLEEKHTSRETPRPARAQHTHPVKCPGWHMPSLHTHISATW